MVVGMFAPLYASAVPAEFERENATYGELAGDEKTGQSITFSSDDEHLAAVVYGDNVLSKNSEVENTPSDDVSTNLAELADTGTSVLYCVGLSAVLFVTGSCDIGWQMYRAPVEW